MGIDAPESTADYRPQGGVLPVISPELTSELLHCLSTLSDPWSLAKITIDMEKPSQWVSKLCRLYFADEQRTVGLPSATHVPDIETALQAVQKILPKLEVRMIEPQWSHNAVWNRKYMEPKTEYTLRQFWADSEPPIGQKSSPSSEVKDDTKLSPPIDLLTHKLELSRHCSVFCVVLVWFVFFGLFLCLFVFLCLALFPG